MRSTLYVLQREREFAQSTNASYQNVSEGGYPVVYVERVTICEEEIYTTPI